MAVFFAYRSPMPPAPWAIPTASECANLGWAPEPEQPEPDPAPEPDTRETLATMERVFGKATPREKAGIARVLLRSRADAR